MTPHKNARGGSLLVDLVFPKPVGRICRASGTSDPKAHARVVAFLRDLQDVHGRADLLLAIKRGQRRGGLSIAQVWAHRRNLAALPSAETLLPLVPVWERWMAAHDVGDEHRDQLGRTLARITELVTPTLGLRSATIADLPALVAALREARRAKGYARAFAYDRTNVLTFCKATLGQSHPLVAQVADVRPFKRTTKREGRPLAVHEFALVAARLGRTFARGRWSERPEEAAARSAEAVALFWTLVTTGMGWKELAGVWEVGPDRVTIRGTKREARVRAVPRVLAPDRYTRPVLLTEDAFAQRLESATKGIGHRSPYDLRRTFAVLCDDARLPVSRQDFYQGHGPKTMSDLYRQRRLAEITPHLNDDAAAIRAVLDQPPPSLELVRDA
jgi:integrase